MSLSVDPRLGTELFGYRIEVLLGRGGMSVVYRAHDLALDRKVALKLLAPELAEDEHFRARFLKESRLAASLDHPNVIPIYEAGESAGLLCIAMRYVEGIDLKRLLREQGALEPDRALAVCSQVASALDAAHELGLVHRDVKPSNVLIARSDHCYLADFGLTQEAADRGDPTQAGQVLGSVDYAAPEQIEGEPVDGRADVYSLGCLLYECLTGSVPFPRDTDLAVLWAHVNDAPPPLDAYPALDPVVRRALAKDRADRYATCGELVGAARAALPQPDAARLHIRPLALSGTVAAIAIVGGLAAGLALAFSGGNGRPKADLTVRNNTLVRIDPAKNKIVRVSPVGNGPESVAVGDNTVWVYNWRDGTVSEVNARTGAAAPAQSIDGSSPGRPSQSIAADANGAWVLSTSNGAGLLTHLRPGLLPEATSFSGDPVAIALGRHAVWVGATGIRGSVVLEFDPRTGAELGTVRVGPSDVQSVAVGEGAVWALSQDGTLSRIAPASRRVMRKTQLPTEGADVASVATGYGAVWELQYQPTLLLRIDPRTLRVTKRIPQPSVADSASIGGAVPNLVVGDGAVWWNGVDTGTIWRIEPSSGKVDATIHFSRPIETQNGPATSLFEAVGMATGAGAVWVTASLPF